MKTSGQPRRPMWVRMIGSLRIRTRDRDLDAYSLGGPKPRQLLEILLLHRGTVVSRNEIAELLWNGDPPGHPEATLESYISVLRRHLQPGQRTTGPLRAATDGYLIEPGLLNIDLDRFEALVRAAGPACPEQAYGLLCRALELTGEPLLADEMHQDWAETERARHTLQVTETRIRASETALRIGRIQEAIDWAQLALHTDRVSDRGWTALILALEAAGRPAEALQAYERYRHLLDRELGCVPGPALRAARNRLLAGAADGHAELSEAAAALACLYEHRPGTAAEPADPRALSAAADTLAGYVHKALHQQPAPGPTEK